jgi:radical SAM superfamily enzyme YgiQ (UPF0313 family)
MRILLVYPETPDSFWSLKYALSVISKKALLPPLGLLTIAAMLPETWEKKLIDMTIETLTDKDIQWADLVFVSGMYVQKESAQKVITRCKESGATVVAGGPLFTAAYEDFENVDHFVLNEAEITLPSFINDLNSGKAKHIYRTEQWANVEHTPIPQWDLLDMDKYAVMGIQSSRGCPFRCDFCDVTMLFGNEMRTKTQEQVVMELEKLYSLGWRDHVFIVDDNFIGNKVKVKKEILPAMIKWMEQRQQPFTLGTQASINLANDEELMDLMVSAGFTTVFIGIESPDEESLAECDKVQNTNNNLIESVKKIQSFGLQVQGGFILGFDSDKPSIFDDMIAFIQESGIVTAMVGLLNAPRGTKLYDRLLESDRLLDSASGSNTDYSMNFIPIMNKHDLIAGYKKVVETIYAPRLYYERIKTLFQNYKPLPNEIQRLSWQSMKLLLKSSWLLGVREKGRFHYWKIIFWGMFKRPELIHMVITLSVYGHHFRKSF